MASQTDNQIKSIIKGWTAGQIAGVHTCMPGKVVSYNVQKNRADVQPTGDYKTEDRRYLPYPIIHAVPCYFPIANGGRSGITFPVKPGDGCLILFAEGQITDFLEKGGSDSEDPRRHSLNDAICLPGLYSEAVAPNKEYPNDVNIVNSEGKMRLGEDHFNGQLKDGTDFSFSGKDLVVNGISLCHHVHGGVTPGSSDTSGPH